MTTCPPDYTQVVQTDCWGWVVGSDDTTIGPLPLYDSGAVRNTAYCRVGTEGLADGTYLRIHQTLTCSAFVLGPAAGAKASAPKISAADQDRLAKAKGMELP